MLHPYMNSLQWLLEASQAKIRGFVAAACRALALSKRQTPFKHEKSPSGVSVGAIPLRTDSQVHALCDSRLLLDTQSRGSVACRASSAAKRPGVM